jgi:Zn-dependent M28 family amino/carboxypeptidase
VFDPRFQRALATALPGIVERIDTALPIWWPVVGSPGLVALGGVSGRRGAVAAGVAGCALATALFLDIHRSPLAPGANDNLSAVAVLVALAEAMRERPLPGLRLMLVSCGAEEVLQGGIHGFARRHLAGLDPERTWVLNLDTLGSPELVLLEGEGPVVMEDYFDRGFRDLIARAAEAEDVPARRGMRARASTDAVVPSRRGFPTATIASMDRYKALSNYHQLTDTPENLRYRTVARAAMVAEAVARRLADKPAPE